MKVLRDEATGYLVLTEISGGVQVLPVELYRSYLSRIADLERQNQALQERLLDIADKNAQAMLNLSNIGEVIKEERRLGVVLGLVGRNIRKNYRLTVREEELFHSLYSLAVSSGLVALPEAKAGGSVSQP